MEPLSHPNKLLILFCIINVLILDLVAGYFVYKFFSTAPASPPKLGGDREVVNVDICGPDCQKYINTRVEELKSGRVEITSVPSPTPVVIYKTTPKTKVRSVYYVSIPGSGSTLANDWVDLAGTEFYFDKSDYPGLVEIYFETNMHLMNGNGTAFVRLYDTVHGVGVQGSNAQTNSQVSTLVVSGQVTFWGGKNLIRVQAKSLTADTAIFDSGRLRIVTEN